MILFRHYAALWTLMTRREKWRKLWSAVLLAWLCFLLLTSEQELRSRLDQWMEGFHQSGIVFLCWMLHGLIIFLNSQELVTRQPTDRVKDQLIFYRRAGFTSRSFFLLQLLHCLPMAALSFFLHRFLFQWAQKAGVISGCLWSIVFSFLPALLWLLLALKHLYARRTNSAKGHSLWGSWRFADRRRAQGAYYMSNPFLLLLPLFSGFSLFFIASITKSGLIGILFPGHRHRSALPAAGRKLRAAHQRAGLRQTGLGRHLHLSGLQRL